METPTSNVNCVKSRPDPNAYIERCRELGAVEGRMIDPATVVTAPWVRLKCQYGCQCYNKNRCCPPYTPTDEQTRKILDSYSCALLIRFKGHERVNEVVVSLEKEMLRDGYYKAFAFGAGPCLLCERCDTERCTFVSDARPSLSGCGVDVFATVRANGFAMKVETEDPAVVDCFGLILVE